MIGQLYVFEGVDGVGKSTIAKRLTAELSDAGRPCDYLSFPGREKGSLGKHVYRLHHNPQAFSIDDISAASLQLLHVAAHIDAIETRIVPTLAAGRDVVLDRYWWSTWVYGLVSGATPDVLHRMIDLESIAWRGVTPACVFLLQRESPIGTPKSEQWVRLAEAYADLARRESHLYPVKVVPNEGDGPAEAIESIRLTAGLHPDCSTEQRVVLPAGSTTRSTGPVAFRRLSPARPTPVYDSLWRFAAERQAIFHRRARGEPPPWTEDAILRRHRFTNAYRASDRVSQYLIADVQYAGDQSPQELFFRTLLFKFFNKIETWELLRREFGELRAAVFDVDRFDAVLAHAMAAGQRVYSGAYIMPTGGSSGRKHRMHLELLDRMLEDGLALRIADAGTMRQAFLLLRSYPTIGDFLAYQYITDLNYSALTNFEESELVVPGPGAIDGLRKCFATQGGLSDAEVIRIMTERQQSEFERLGLSFESLWGRPLQLIDCQNLLCEIGKYARVAHPEFAGVSGRTRIKQVFRRDLKPLTLFYPPKWRLNERIPTRAQDDAPMLQFSDG